MADEHRSLTSVILNFGVCQRHTDLIIRHNTSEMARLPTILIIIADFSQKINTFEKNFSYTFLFAKRKVCKRKAILKTERVWRVLYI